MFLFLVFANWLLLSSKKTFALIRSGKAGPKLKAKGLKVGKWSGRRHERDRHITITPSSDPGLPRHLPSL